MIVTIADYNVYYAGKVIGRVNEVRQDDEGLRLIATITDNRMKQYLRGGAAQVSLTV